MQMTRLGLALSFVVGIALGAVVVVAFTLAARAGAHALWGPDVDGAPAGFALGAISVITAGSMMIARAIDRGALKFGAWKVAIVRLPGVVRSVTNRNLVWRSYVARLIR